MTDLNCNATTPDCREVSIYRPEDIQEMFGIKQRTYYHRLKFLGIEAYKDEDGKPYLDEHQVDILEELDDYIKQNGKMDGFTNSPNGGLVKASRNGKLADQMTEEDLPEDLKEKVRLAREAANPKFTPQEVATNLLQQWRAKRNNGGQ